MFANYYEFRDWIENFIPLVYGKEELGLSRIEELLRRLGNPQNKFKSIHVAGTAGKGSTAFYTARLLAGSRVKSRESRGLKIGMHVSPHLNYIGERMQIFQGQGSRVKGQVIPVTRLVELGNEIKPVVEGIGREKPELTPSYFEILVAISLMYFAREKVDYAVVEVGLGGRLDATNVLVPEVSVITNIGLDHTDILGDSIEKIAEEKAGIVKVGVPVVTGAEGEALGVIERVAKGQNSKVISQNFKSKFKIYEELGIEKYCTEETFWLAAKTAELVIGKELETAVVKEAFSVGFAGRFEEIEQGVILDGAHNPDKIRSLIEFIKNPKSEIRNPKSVILVLGFKTGKNWQEMIDILLKDLPIREVVATQYQAVTDTGKGSAVKPEEICDYITKVHSAKCMVVNNSQGAVWKAMRVESQESRVPPEGRAGEGLVIVTGSLYLVGEVRTMWKLPEV